jgi:hypothetical protein
MNWEAIGAIGEVLGAVAVVLTLIYLGIQIRQNTQQMENHFKGVDLTSFNAIDESFSRFRAMLATNPDLAELWQATLDNYSALEGTNKLRADALMKEWLVIYQNMVHRTMLVNRDSGPLLMNDLMERIIAREFSHQGVRQWWSQHQHDFFPHFTALVEETLKEIPIEN